MATRRIEFPSIHKPTAFEVGAGCARRTREFFDGSSNHQQDAVDWYRGFCDALGAEADPKVLADIRQKVTLVQRAIGHQTRGVIERLLAGLTPVEQAPATKRSKGKP